MPFFVRYVVVYVLVAVVLLGIVAYTGYEAGMGPFTWIAVGVFAFWMFGYHGTMLWLDYRRLSQLVTDVRAGKLDQHLQPERLRDSIRYLAVRYGGVPDIVAALLVRRVVTDELATQLATRLRAGASAAQIERIVAR